MSEQATPHFDPKRQLAQIIFHHIMHTPPIDLTPKSILEAIETWLNSNRPELNKKRKTQQ